jgi:hypothetical protein
MENANMYKAKFPVQFQFKFNLVRVFLELRTLKARFTLGVRAAKTWDQL